MAPRWSMQCRFLVTRAAQRIALLSALIAALDDPSPGPGADEDAANSGLDNWQTY